MRSKGFLIVVSSLILISCLVFIWGCGSVSKGGITRLYLAGRGNYIYAFNVESLTIESSIYLPLANTFVHGVALSPDKRTLYALGVPNWYFGYDYHLTDPLHGNWLLYAIDLATRDLSFTYIVPADINYTWLGCYLAVTPDGQRIITASKLKPAVLSFSTSPLSFEAYTPTDGGDPSYPCGLVISADGRYAYVGNWAYNGSISSSEVYKYDIAAKTIVGTVELDPGYGIGMPSFNPAGDKLYVPSPYDSGTGKVFIIDLAPDFTLETTSIDVGNYPWGIGFSADGKKAYVTNMIDNSILVVSTEVGAYYKVLTDEAGSVPCNVVMDHARNRAYVNGREDGYITIIDTINDTVEAQIVIDSRSDQITPASVMTNSAAGPQGKNSRQSIRPMAF